MTGRTSSHAPDAALAADLAWCEEQVRRGSKSFHFAFRTLPREKASAVWAIYAFCRRFDDAVDEPAAPDDFDVLRLQWARFRAGETPDAHMWRALRWAFRRFGLETAPFDDLVRGLDGDRSFVQPPDDAALFEYCHLVAGTVGRMLLPVLATHGRDGLRDTAVRLGDAMQLTNILRDVGEDVRMGRVYLPARAMEEEGVTADGLAAQHASEAFVALWERYARIAESWYDEFLATVPRYDADSRRPLRLAAKAYRAILHEVRRHDYDCLVNRNVLPRWRKLAISLGGWFA